MSDKTVVNGVAVHIGTDTSELKLSHWGQGDRECVVISMGHMLSMHMSAASPEALHHLADLIRQAALIRQDRIAIAAGKKAAVIPLHLKPMETGDGS